MLEFVEAQAVEQEAGQLFSTRDPKKTEIFGAQVFKQMCGQAGLYPLNTKTKDKSTITRYRGGDELILGTTFESGVQDPELGPLINLDYFDKLLNGGGWTEYDRAEIKGKAGAAIKAFVEERKKFMNVTESRYPVR